MKKNRLKMIWFLAFFLVGGVIGFITGAGYSGSIMKSYMQDSNASWLSTHIHRLAMLRNNNIDGCIASIERDIDNCVLQITGGADRNRRVQVDVERLPEFHLRALQVARVYFDAGFESSFSQDSAKVLSLIEPRNERYCSEDLQFLQEQASRQKESRK
jgi:hypothetical protein